MTPKKEWEKRFLAELAGSGNVRASCQAAGVSRKTVYQRRGDDEAFAALWDEALEEACDLLEAEARRRAVEGTQKPVFYRGEEVGRVREYSDTLLIVLLKANRPEKFRERSSVEHSGKGGGPIPIAMSLDLSRLSDDDLAQLEQIAAKATPDTLGDPGGAGAEGET